MSSLMQAGVQHEWGWFPGIAAACTLRPSCAGKESFVLLESHSVRAASLFWRRGWIQQQSHLPHRYIAALAQVGLVRRAVHASVRAGRLHAACQKFSPD